MVVGMPRHEKHTPTLAIRCLMDCDGNTIDSDHPAYGKEQNIGLHGVIHPAAMSRVTTKETFDIEGYETTFFVGGPAASMSVCSPGTCWIIAGKSMA